MPELFQVAIEDEDVAPLKLQDVPVLEQMEVAVPKGAETLMAPKVIAPVIKDNAKQREDSIEHEAREAKKRDFTLAVLKAREPAPEPVASQPVAPGMAERTAAEMSEGARMNQVHADAKANRPALRPSAAEVAAQGSSTPVFRPADFIPDPMKAVPPQGRNL